MAQDSKKPRIAFMHPDMNVWNSSHLDSILKALEIKNYDITVYRPNDPKSEHYINYFPRSLCGHFVVLLAYVRFILCAIHMLMDKKEFDYIIINEVSYPIPVLRLKCNKILFYCDNP